jgi:hypothetical protein
MTPEQVRSFTRGVMALYAQVLGPEADAGDHKG